MAFLLAGTEELKAALLALPAAVETKVLRQSALAGAKVVRGAVQAAAPVSSGLFGRRRSSGRVTPPGVLKRAVVLKFAKELSNQEAATYVVTVRHGKGEQKNNRDAFYYLWVEKGHRVVGRSKRVIGNAPAHPFFVPAYRASAGTARERMKSTMEAQMTALIKGGGNGPAGS